MRAVLFLLAAALCAEPRVFVPDHLEIGSVNELYVWDEAPVGAFQVEVRRADTNALAARAHGFAVDSPLAVAGTEAFGLKWSAALVAPEVLTAPGPVVVRFLRAGKVLAEVRCEIRARDFAVEELKLDRQMTQLRTKPDPRKDRESAEIWKLYQTVNPEFAWAGGRFLLPVGPARVSAGFGDTRRYLYSDGTSAQDFHRGIDFAVPEGTPVNAAAAGRVTLAADRLLTGTTVLLEHAPGVYSVYFHLSKALVKKGQTVAQGERVALSGATGLVTGPHLHWEVRVEGVSVDPLGLVEAALLDTEAVNAVISSIERPIH